MRLIRVHVEAALAPGVRIALAVAAAEHVRRVLRLGVGDAVTLFNGDGEDYPARIASLSRGKVEVAVEGRSPARAESPLAVTLVQGIARNERMDLVVQKTTELGVGAIVPVATARSVVKLDRDNRERKLAHWRGIVVAACEQCGRARLPSVAEPRTLADYLAAPPAGCARLLLAADVQVSLAAAAHGLSAVEVLIGPEGGLTDGEREAAIAVGYRTCRLGPRVLRSETAAVAALAVLQSVAGDLGGV
jgi:16S rRNA (uracil1498-N3)-methyltransferase